MQCKVSAVVPIVITGVLVLVGVQLKMYPSAYPVVYTKNRLIPPPLKSHRNRTQVNLELPVKKNHNHPISNSQSQDVLNKFCGSDVTVMADPQTRDHFSNVHLLVTLNSPFWKVVPLVDALYKPYFRRITYCSVPGNVTDADTLRNQGYDIITYHIPDPAGLGPGYLGYQCWTELFERGLISEDTVGVLGIADDMIISIQNMRKLNLNSIWRLMANRTFDLETGEVCKPEGCSTKIDWGWWGQRFVPQYRRALQDLKTMAANGEQPYKDCYRQLATSAGKENRLFGGHTNDIQYVPKRYLPQYSTILKVFFKHKSFLETTISTVLSCVENRTETQRLGGLNIWSNRGEPWRMFPKFRDSRAIYFYHPVKWSPLVLKKNNNNTEAIRLKEFLCSELVPYLSISNYTSLQV